MPIHLLADLPTSLPDELIETLLETPRLRIERIVSLGHATPPECWYDQRWPEWVLVLRGAARLRLASGEALDLRPGDAVNLAAGERHRVEWTTTDEATVWLAIHYEGESSAPS
jgi:cupin 2 domain-containing protein